MPKKLFMDALAVEVVALGVVAVPDAVVAPGVAVVQGVVVAPGAVALPALADWHATAVLGVAVARCAPAEHCVPGHFGVQAHYHGALVSVVTVADSQGGLAVPPALGPENCLACLQHGLRWTSYPHLPVPHGLVV